MWKNLITNHVKMSFKKSALVIVGNVPIRLAESVEKKNSQVLCVCLQESKILKVQLFEECLQRKSRHECIVLSETILVLLLTLNIFTISYCIFPRERCEFKGLPNWKL